MGSIVNFYVFLSIIILLFCLDSVADMKLKELKESIAPSVIVAIIQLFVFQKIVDIKILCRRFFEVSSCLERSQNVDNKKKEEKVKEYYKELEKLPYRKKIKIKNNLFYEGIEFNNILEISSIEFTNATIKNCKMDDMILRDVSFGCRRFKPFFYVLKIIPNAILTPSKKGSIVDYILRKSPKNTFCEIEDMTLNRTKLEHIDFIGAEISWDKKVYPQKSGDTPIKNIDMRKVCFWGAKIKNANLNEVKGLKAQDFMGATLENVHLPCDIIQDVQKWCYEYKQTKIDE